MNFILIILLSFAILYTALVYKVYVSFKNKNMELSIFSAFIVPFMIYNLNCQATRELKISHFRMLIDTYLDFDIFVYVLYQIINKEAKGKKVKIKINIRMSKLSTADKKEYTDQMKMAKIF